MLVWVLQYTVLDHLGVLYTCKVIISFKPAFVNIKNAEVLSQSNETLCCRCRSRNDQSFANVNDSVAFCSNFSCSVAALVLEMRWPSTIGNFKSASSTGICKHKRSPRPGRANMLHCLFIFIVGGSSHIRWHQQHAQDGVRG